MGNSKKKSKAVTSETFASKLFAKKLVR